MPASITLLPEITRKVRPPRSLAELQRGVVRALLELLERDDVPFIAEL